MAILHETPRPSFVAVRISTLSVSDVLPVDMYLRPSENAPPILYRERRVALPPDEVERLAARGVETIYIPKGQISDYHQHLRENVNTVIADENVPLERRAQFLSETGRGMLDEVFRAGSTQKAVEAANDISGYMTELLARNQMLVSDLLEVLRHDYYTYTHSYNVATYAVLLAQGLGIRDAVELQAISLGGLLHDLGKTHVPPGILHKKEKLTSEEWSIIKQHPTRGFVELCSRPDLTFAQLMMVYQHHEKLDGSGYPVGVGASEIHQYARLCAVVDIFEALTSIRPYRSPMPAEEAIGELEREAESKLDGEMVRCWKSLINPARRSGRR
jgi:HD-GYP domain-containing protein (c-di-GMP phosphodiesterase class II)